MGFLTRPRILVFAGEVSGDQHGALVVDEIRHSFPEASFFGTGGGELAQRGVTLWANLDDLAVMGFVEVVPRIPYFRRLRREVFAEIDRMAPDLVILVDYPGFNLGVAHYAHRKGIPVLYYIPPKVWAWRKGRVHRLAECTDRVAAILPFEEEWLRANGVDAHYVGNPLLDRPCEGISRSDFCAEMELDPTRPIMALLPGSRVQEVRAHMEAFTDIALGVVAVRPDVQVVVSRAPGIPSSMVGCGCGPATERTATLLEHADVALVKSGTSTLEAVLAEAPFVIAYRTHPITAFVATKVLGIDRIGLPNLILGEDVYPEFVQGEVDVRHVTPVLLELLDPTSERAATQRRASRTVRDSLGGGGVASRVARMAVELIEA